MVIYFEPISENFYAASLDGFIFFFGNPGIYTDQFWKHEYGHVQQQQKYGNYYYILAFASICTALTGNHDLHSSMWWEQEANDL